MNFEKYLPNLNLIIPTNSFPNETIFGFAGKIPMILDLDKTKGLCYQFNSKNRQEIEIYIENILLSIIARTVTETYEITIVDLNINSRNLNLTKLANSNKKIRFVRKYEELGITLTGLWDKAIFIHENKLTDSNNLIEFNNKALNSGIRQEPFRFLFINDFPINISSNDLIILHKLVTQATRSGIYIFLAFDIDQYNKNTIRPDEDIKLLNDLVRQMTIIWEDSFGQYSIKNISNDLESIFRKLAKRASINFSSQPFIFDNSNGNLVDFLAERFNNQSINTRQNRIQIPIGKKENNNILHFAFGERINAYHGFIIGITGQGKSALLNRIIWEIAVNYTPKEVLLYLIDFSNVSFKFHKNHPNLAFLIENREKENIINAVKLLESLELLYSERTMTHNISNIDDYNEKAKKEGREIIPNIIVIIDEVHHFFDNIEILRLSTSEKNKLTQEELANYNDRAIKDRVNDMFDVITRDYRKAGIHLLLATQHIDKLGINNTIVDNMLIRVSFKITQYERASGFFPKSKRKLSSLNILEAYITTDGDDIHDEEFINTQKCFIEPPKYKNEAYLSAYDKIKE